MAVSPKLLSDDIELGVALLMRPCMASFRRYQAMLDASGDISTLSNPTFCHRLSFFSCVAKLASPMLSPQYPTLTCPFPFDSLNQNKHIVS